MLVSVTVAPPACAKVLPKSSSPTPGVETLKFAKLTAAGGAGVLAGISVKVIVIESNVADVKMPP